MLVVVGYGMRIAGYVELVDRAPDLPTVATIVVAVIAAAGR